MVSQAGLSLVFAVKNNDLGLLLQLVLRCRVLIMSRSVVYGDLVALSVHDHGVSMCVCSSFASCPISVILQDKICFAEITSRAIGLEFLFDSTEDFLRIANEILIVGQPPKIIEKVRALPESLEASFVLNSTCDRNVCGLNKKCKRRGIGSKA